MNCEDCIYYEEQPFIREGDYNSYCKRTNKTTTPYDYCRKHKKQKKKGECRMNDLYCYYCSKHLVNFHSPISRYHYNEQYNLWTIVLINNDTFFIYDKNIHKLSIIDDEEELYGLCVNGKTKIYKPMGELNDG